MGAITRLNAMRQQCGETRSKYEVRGWRTGELLGGEGRQRIFVVLWASSERRVCNDGRHVPKPD